MLAILQTLSIDFGQTKTTIFQVFSELRLVRFYSNSSAINGYARIFCFPIAFQGLLLPFSSIYLHAVSQKSSCSETLKGALGLLRSITFAHYFTRVPERSRVDRFALVQTIVSNDNFQTNYLFLRKCPKIPSHLKGSHN